MHRQDKEQTTSLLSQYSVLPSLTPTSEVPLEMDLSLSLSSIEPVVPSPSVMAQTLPVLEKDPLYINVTVKKGDVLEKIAKNNHSSVSAIMKANNLSSTQLKIGQVLKIPTNAPLASSSTPAKVVENKGAEEFYVVKEGDSPWVIASKNHVKLEELLQLNQLDEQKARRLRPGDRIRIR